MHFTKLDKPPFSFKSPLSIKPPTSPLPPPQKKSAWKNKPSPGGLIEDLWYLSKPVLGGHPVLSGHYSIPQGCPLNTVVWKNNETEGRGDLKEMGGLLTFFLWK